MKFEEAFCEYENRIMSLNEVKSVYSKSPIEYRLKYNGTFFCPECKKAKLSFKNDSPPYFSTYPNDTHLPGCSMQQPELSANETKMLLNDNKNNELIHRQLTTLASQLIQPVAKSPKKAVVKSISKGSVKSINNKSAKKRIPQRRLDLPLTNDDFNKYKMFYGKVNLEWKYDKETSRYIIKLFNPETRRFICLISITDKVYSHIENTFKGNGDNCYIAFFAEMKKAKKDYNCCTLLRSDFLYIIKS